MSQLLSEWVAHPTEVNCLTISKSSGRLIATGGEDCKINIWRHKEENNINGSGSAENIWTLGGNKTPIESLCFDDREQCVISGAMSGTLKVYDLKEGKVARQLRGHSVNCCTIHYHPFGEFIASGSADTTMKVWDVRQKSCIQTFTGHSKEITCCKFSPDGRWVASSSKDGSLMIWDLIAGKLLDTIVMKPQYVQHFIFNPADLVLAAVLNNKSIRVHDVETMEKIAQIAPESSGSIKTIAFCGKEADSLCYAAGESIKRWGWDPVGNQGTMQVGWERVADMVVTGHDDSQVVAGVYNSNFVSLWNVDLNQVNSNTPGNSPPSQWRRSSTSSSSSNNNNNNNSDSDFRQPQQQRPPIKMDLHQQRERERRRERPGDRDRDRDVKMSSPDNDLYRDRDRDRDRDRNNTRRSSGDNHEDVDSSNGDDIECHNEQSMKQVKEMATSMGDSFWNRRGMNIHITNNNNRSNNKNSSNEEKMITNTTSSTATTAPISVASTNKAPRGLDTRSQERLDVSAERRLEGMLAEKKELSDSGRLHPSTTSNSTTPSTSSATMASIEGDRPGDPSISNSQNSFHTVREYYPAEAKTTTNTTTSSASSISVSASVSSVDTDVNATGYGKRQGNGGVGVGLDVPALRRSLESLDAKSNNSSSSNSNSSNSNSNSSNPPLPPQHYVSSVSQSVVSQSVSPSDHKQDYKNYNRSSRPTTSSGSSGSSGSSINSKSPITTRGTTAEAKIMSCDPTNSISSGRTGNDVSSNLFISNSNIGSNTPSSSSSASSSSSTPSLIKTIDNCLTSSTPFFSSLSQRLSTLRMLKKFWSQGDTKEAIQQLQTLVDGAFGDTCQLMVIGDFIRSVEPTLNKGLSLDDCQLLLPILEALMGVGVSSTATGSGMNENSAAEILCSCAARAMLTMLKCFGTLIKQTRSVIVANGSNSSNYNSYGNGVDMAQEARLIKCNKCHAVIVRVKQRLDSNLIRQFKNIRNSRNSKGSTRNGSRPGSSSSSSSSSSVCNDLENLGKAIMNVL